MALLLLRVHERGIFGECKIFELHVCLTTDLAVHGRSLTCLDLFPYFDLIHVTTTTTTTTTTAMQQQRATNHA